MLFGVCVLCRILHCLVSRLNLYLNVRFSRLITSVAEERAVLSAIDYLYFCCFYSKEFFWERLRSFIVELPGPSIYQFC